MRKKARMPENENDVRVADRVVWTHQHDICHAIVELADGRYAFVWGNLAHEGGDWLPWRCIDAPTDARGVEIHPSYESAEESYRRCAAALAQLGVSGEVAAAEMLAAL